MGYQKAVLKMVVELFGGFEVYSNGTRLLGIDRTNLFAYKLFGHSNRIRISGKTDSWTNCIFVVSPSVAYNSISIQGKNKRKCNRF